MKRTLLLAVLPLVVFAASGSFTKTPFDSLNVTLDFCQGGAAAATCMAPAGVTLVSVQAFNVATGSNDTSSIIVQSNPAPAIVNNTSGVPSVSFFRVQSGTPNQIENLIVHVTKIDTGEQIEGNVLMTVQLPR